MHGISGLLILMVLVGCTKQSNFSSIEVIGHAGMGLSMGNSMFHDNSKEAIEFALQMRGCDGVEVDVQLSKEGDLWLYHDTKLDSESTGEGCIPDKMKSELALLNYKTWRKEKLIPLAELNPTLLFGKTIYLDLRTVNECLNQSINSALLIQRLNEIDFLNIPEIQVILLTNNVVLANKLIDSFYSVYLDVTEYQMAQQSLQANPIIQGIVIRNSAISQEEVKMIQNLGKKVVLYDMRSAVGIRKALKKNPDSIMTDDLREAIIETN
jgi:glycerophosphoryl diester phosphodiesterase